MATWPNVDALPDVALWPDPRRGHVVVPGRRLQCADRPSALPIFGSQARRPLPDLRADRRHRLLPASPVGTRPGRRPGGRGPVGTAQPTRCADL